MLSVGSIDKYLIRNTSLAIAMVFALPPTAALADTPMTAGVIMEKMSNQDRFNFVAGMVEGFAYARFIADGKKEDGLRCIYDWFYRGPAENSLRIYDAFERYPDYPPGPIVWVILKKQCGE